MTATRFHPHLPNAFRRGWVRYNAQVVEPPGQRPNIMSLEDLSRGAQREPPI